MSDQAEQFERLKRVKAAHQEMLMRKPNVVGVGIGYAHRGESVTDQLALVVMVNQKLPQDALAEEDMIPRELDGIPVDVQQVGDIRAME